MDALKLICSRRSTRAYLQTPVEKEKIDAILQAGRYAPSGGNNQTTHFLVVNAPKVLADLVQIAQRAFSAMEEQENMYASLRAAVRRAKEGKYIFHYGAPTLIITANKKDYGNAMADCACALENMMLMANALGLGSCWINQLKWLNEDENLITYLQPLGLAPDEIICGAMSLGYAATKDRLPPRKPLERKGNPVTWIE